MSDNFMNNANATSIMTAVGNKIKTRDKTFYGTEAQWAALTTAQKKEYDFKATPDWGTKNPSAFDYSTSEKLIGTWIDGKPLYQKTVYLASLTVPVNTPTVWDVSVPIDNLAHFFGTFDVPGDQSPKLIMNNNHITNLGVNSELAIWHGTGFGVLFNQTFGDASTAFTNLNATIQYTKTTD